VGSTAGRILGIVSAAGFEALFEEVSAPPAPPDVAAVVTIAARYNVEIHPG
jgi:hypothetical protein